MFSFLCFFGFSFNFNVSSCGVPKVHFFNPRFGPDNSDHQLTHYEFCFTATLCQPLHKVLTSPKIIRIPACLSPYIFLSLRLLVLKSMSGAFGSENRLIY